VFIFLFILYYIPLLYVPHCGVITLKYHLYQIHCSLTVSCHWNIRWWWLVKRVSRLASYAEEALLNNYVIYRNSLVVALPSLISSRRVLRETRAGNPLKTIYREIASGVYRIRCSRGFMARVYVHAYTFSSVCTFNDIV